MIHTCLWCTKINLYHLKHNVLVICHGFHNSCSVENLLLKLVLKLHENSHFLTHLWPSSKWKLTPDDWHLLGLKQEWALSRETSKLLWAHYQDVINWNGIHFNHSTCQGLNTPSTPKPMTSNWMQKHERTTFWGLWILIHDYHSRHYSHVCSPFHLVYTYTTSS